MKNKSILWIVFAAFTSLLSACGGGSSVSNSATGNATPSNTSSKTSASVSSGTITAFGSVFVNGHEYATTGATVIDDDSGTTTTTTSGLEVGEVVDVIPASDSTDAKPIARELHIHPLVRGYVDSSNTTAASLKVMGQTVQITATTLFSDRRACVSDTTNPCTAISDQSGLTATTGTDSTAVAGSYVTVNGYLYDGSNTGTTTSANIVATLISIGDVPNSTDTMAAFKAEGVVTAINNAKITIGGLNVDLSSAKCVARGMQSDCASAFKTGEVVSTYAAAAPSLPATDFTADGARLSARIPANVAGLSVEIDGVVSSVTTSPAGFVVRGVNIDATGLPADTTLPQAGDIVQVEGSVSSDGTSIVASSVKILRAAASAYYEFVGDDTKVIAGTDASTYILTLLGQDIMVNTTTVLADRSSATWQKQDPATNPFNISTFQTYLAGSASQHLVVKAAADTSGKLTALSVTIVPASAVSSVAGKVDADPAPVNSSTTGTPSTFAIHGVAISADPASVIQPGGTQTTVAAGNKALVVGNYTAGTMTITAPKSSSNVVVIFDKQDPVQSPTPITNPDPVPVPGTTPTPNPAPTPTPAPMPTPLPLPMPMTLGGGHGMM